MSSHHLLIDLEAAVRRSEPAQPAAPSPPPGWPPLPPGTCIHTQGDFDWSHFDDMLGDALGDGEGEMPAGLEYWARQLQQYGFIILQLPEGWKP